MSERPGMLIVPMASRGLSLTASFSLAPANFEHHRKYYHCAVPGCRQVNSLKKLANHINQKHKHLTAAQRDMYRKLSHDQGAVGKDNENLLRYE